MQKLALCALLLLCCISYSQAQKPASKTSTLPPTVSKESLLKDPNILWIAESEDVMILDLYDQSKAEDTSYLQSVGLPKQRRIRCAPLKTQFNRQQIFAYPEEQNLACELFQTKYIDKLSLYKDADCSQKIPSPNSRSVSSVDTIITVDPKTMQQTKQVVNNELDCSKIKTYQVKQLFYFDQKANTFGSLLISFAPMVEITDDMGKPLGKTQTSFWLKVENSPKVADLNNDNIRWARQTQRHFFPEQLKTIKSTKSLTECFGLQLETIRKNHQTEDVRGTFDPSQKLSSKELKNMGVAVDTIITFDPQTFKETSTVQTVKIDEKSLNSLRFIQEWYWDSKNNKMQVHNLLFAPIINRYDDQGKFLMSGPMFFKPSK